MKTICCVFILAGCVSAQIVSNGVATSSGSGVQVGNGAGGLTGTNCTINAIATDAAYCPGGFYATSLAQDGTTVVNKGAVLTGANLVLAGTSQTTPTYVVTKVVDAGHVYIQTFGQASLVASGATTAGHYVLPSSSAAGSFDDSATCPAGDWYMGRWLTSNGGGGTYVVQLSPGWCPGAAGSGSVNVNGGAVSNPNFNATTPAAGAGFLNATWQVSGSSVSAELPLPFSNGGTGTSYQDVTETAAPANPGAGVDRLYLNSTSHTLACLTSGGANCMPSSAANGSTNYVQVNNAGALSSDAGFQWDLTNHKLGVNLGAGVLTDVAFAKFGALAANRNDGADGTAVANIALAHTINDTNFPNKQYVFGYEDDNVVSISNGGANNTGYIAFRAVPKGNVAGTVLPTLVAFQDETYWTAGVAAGTVYGFYSQPTNSGTAGTGTRKAVEIWDTLGNKFNNNYGIHINNMTNGNNNYAYVDDCNGCRSYISNSLSVGSQQNSFALTNDMLTVFGHFGIGTKGASAGNKPTIAVNACGSTTQGTVSGADSLGTITVGTTAVTSCALTFNQAFASAPICFVEFQDGTTGIGHGVSTTTAVLTVSFASDASSKKVGYHCITPVVN